MKENSECVCNLWSTVMKENNDGVYYYCIKVMWENGEVAF